MTFSQFTLRNSRFAIFSFFLFLFVSTIYAHAELIESSPAPGEELTKSPAEIHLTFNEPVTADSTITLFTPTFQTISGLTATTDPNDPMVVTASLPPLAPNSYTVQWTAVSADGHQITGSYTFELLPPQTQIKPEILLAGFLGIVILAITVRAIGRSRQSET
jgi:methionine-rich copper-binding protein CopC